MKLELTGMTKEYARECTNILLRIRKFIKNPHCRIINYLPLYLLFTVLYLMYIALAGLYLFLGGDSLIIAILIGAMVGMLIFYVFILVNYFKCYKSIYKPDRKASYIFSEQGLEFSDANKDIKMTWDSFQAVRVGRYGMHFIPKASGSVSMSFDIRYKQQIQDYLKANNIDIPFVE